MICHGNIKGDTGQLLGHTIQKLIIIIFGYKLFIINLPFMLGKV